MPIRQCGSSKKIATIRTNIDDECSDHHDSYLLRCCPPSLIKRENTTLLKGAPTDTPTDTSTKDPIHNVCGVRNPDGVGFFTTNDTNHESKFGEVKKK